mmetsp:Transcript_43461/g.69951  ORF Transcript_43461/g.69951 Transcript_43461/m.69951 type:complete len:565 (-) Transcript_43461:170-1864(-)
MTTVLTKYDEMKNVIRSAKIRWLEESDITDILVNYQAYGFPISNSTAQKPITTGSLFLYNTTLGTDWRSDGYVWDPAKEKVVRLDVTVYGPLSCMMSDGVGVSRRGYWLESQSNIVLTQYLNISAHTQGETGLPFFSGFGIDSELSLSSNLSSNTASAIDANATVELLTGESAESSKCDVFLNPDPPAQAYPSNGMRRIKTSPGALSSLANTNPFQFSTPERTIPNVVTPEIQLQSNPAKRVATQQRMQHILSRNMNLHRRNDGRNGIEGTVGNSSGLSGATNFRNSAGIGFPIPAGGVQNKGGLRRIMSSPMPLDRLGKKEVDNEDPEKTSKRKARKAEVARACRKRKKAYIQSLEQKAAALQRKLAEMASNASQSKSEEDVHGEEQKNILNEMERAISSPLPDSKEIKKLIHRFVANSRQHRDHFWRHAENTLKSINPGAQAKFALWGLDQDDEFYEKPGLWKTLMSDEIGLDDTQMKKLLRCREKVRDTKNELLEIQNRLIGLRKLMNEHLAKRYKLLDRLLENLKPIQAARFFLWVSKNSSCMQMLQTVILTRRNSTGRI